MRLLSFLLPEQLALTWLSDYKKITMKTIIYKITGVAIMISVVLSSCTKGFQEMNTDPNNVSVAKPGQLLAPAIVNVLANNLIRNRNFNNELMQVSIEPSDADGRIFRYDIRNTVGDGLYNGWYSELTNIKDVYKLSSDSTLPTYNRYYMGVSLILQVWVHSLITDTFGDVPYFQSNKGRDSLIFQPAFDPQRDIYLDMFSKLEQANVLLNATPRNSQEVIDPNSDPIYKGDKAKWRKFGNTLYLRLLMRLSGKAEVATYVIGKIKDIVDVHSADYPIMTSNAETAVLKWTGTAPYISPLGTIRPTDYDGPGLASFFIDNLVNWNDPRIDASGTYVSGTINRWGIAKSGGRFFGLPGGYAPGTNPTFGSYFYSNTQARSLQSDSSTGILMNYAEEQFILAEAAAKGWISGSAATYYNSGALNSITYWLPNWPTVINTQTGLPNDIVTYLIAADMQWIESLTLDQKMERIHLQKYYALFLVDMQQWFEYRRTGHPILPQGAGLVNGGVMPARLMYPVYLQSTNPTNYKIAVERQGPDLISTPVWWQKP
jgi:hypothetical protein